MDYCDRCDTIGFHIPSNSLCPSCVADVRIEEREKGRAEEHEANVQLCKNNAELRARIGELGVERDEFKKTVLGMLDRCKDKDCHIAELEEQLEISRRNEKSAQVDWRLDKVRLDADLKTIRSLLEEVQVLKAANKEKK